MTVVSEILEIVCRYSAEDPRNMSAVDWHLLKSLERQTLEIHKASYDLELLLERREEERIKAIQNYVNSNCFKVTIVELQPPDEEETNERNNDRHK